MDTLTYIGYLAGLFLVSLAVGGISGPIMVKVLEYLTRKTKSTLDDRVLEAIKVPLESFFFLVVFYAMLHALTVVGEASSKVSAELKERHGKVPWQRISGVRHRIVHDYSGLDYELLWQVVTVLAPELAEQVAAIFSAEFPDLDAAGPDPGPAITG